MPVEKSFKDFSTKIKKIKQLGFDGAELAIQDPTKINTQKVKQILDQVGLGVSAIATGTAYTKDKLSLSDSNKNIQKQAIKRIKNQIKFAAQFNCLVIIGLVRGNTGGSKKAERNMATALRECAQYGKKLKVKLVLEAINRYEMDCFHRVDQVKGFIRKWKVLNCGVLADTYHMNIEERSIEQALKKNISLIWHIHFADNNRLAPGQGHIDFKNILKILRKIGYQAWITAEILYKPNFENSAYQTINYLKKIKK